MSCKKTIMQGDSYPIYITMTYNGSPLDLNEVEKIEFKIGDLVKYYNSDGSGEVEYSQEEDAFIFPLSQTETLKFEGSQEYQARVKFVDSKVVGVIGGHIPIQFSETEDVI